MRLAMIALLVSAALADPAGAQGLGPIWPPRPPQNQEAPPNTFWAKTMTFTRHSALGTKCFVDGAWRDSFDIYAVGSFDGQAAARLRAFLAANPPVPYCTTIHFHSSGGVLDIGLEMGRIIRAQKLRTGIGILIRGAAEMVRRSGEHTICFSACSFAFLGGVQRRAGDGYYGVHRFYRREPDDVAPDGTIKRDWRIENFLVEDSQVTMAQLLAYVVAMDVSPDLLIEMSKAAGGLRLKRDEPIQNFLGKETMARLRVTTSMLGAQWEIVNWRGAAAVRAVVPEGDAKHAVVLSCERAGQGAAPEMKLTLFLETRAPDAFLAARRLRIWHRPIDGPRVHGVIVLARKEIVPAELGPAQASAAKDIVGGRAGVVASLPLKQLGIELLRQSQIYFGVAARSRASGATGASTTDDFDNGFSVDIAAGARKIAELMETCR